MRNFLFFLTIFLFFSIFVGCFEDNENTPNCKDGDVYNSRMEMCVFNVCEAPEFPREQYDCEMGCMVVDVDNFIDYYCYKTNPYQN